MSLASLTPVSASLTGIFPRITERFYRVGDDRNRKTGGTGLGLAIVKHVLHSHNAKLEIQSELGKGSEFRCIFPPERKA